ncbi:unnamed protein product [Heligmosomoides polygyrus]|uniref:DDE_Tnp_IS1595 domain-containing protein n=1 Tax=Heligmosomoides polygyrus TaxID=6339 RepID=A0A183GBE9_HELPZ|nr:unnamed protein product [Heligmosomoides polygyrus]
MGLLCKTRKCPHCRELRSVSRQKGTNGQEAEKNLRLQQEILPAPRKQKDGDGIIQATKEIFVEITSKRDSATLDDIVTRHVLPGTIIHADNWKGYGNLSNLGHEHKRVNQSLNFVDPNRVLHTQAIERTWSHIKRAIKRKSGLNGALWNDHFLEDAWKWRNNMGRKLNMLWNEIVRRYPLVEYVHLPSPFLLTYAHF